MLIHLYKNDLPNNLDLGHSVAIDTEAMGLKISRDRLCLVQLSTGDGTAHLIQIAKKPAPAPNLCTLLENPAVEKIFHFARFDIALLKHTFNCVINNVYCTKIASKLTRTFTDRHSLKALCTDLLGIELSKAVQSSNWSTQKLSEEQLKYAASDVLYLHQLKEKLNFLLEDQEKSDLASKYFKALDVITESEISGFEPEFVLSH
jgi:ribonuclease D